MAIDKELSDEMQRTLDAIPYMAGYNATTAVLEILRLLLKRVEALEARL